MTLEQIIAHYEAQLAMLTAKSGTYALEADEQENEALISLTRVQLAGYIAQRNAQVAS